MKKYLVTSDAWTEPRIMESDVNLGVFEQLKTILPPTATRNIKLLDENGVPVVNYIHEKVDYHIDARRGKD